MGNNEFNIEDTQNNTQFWFNDISILFKHAYTDIYVI